MPDITTAGALGYLPTVLKYLNPARSPFYTVMVVATFLVCYCHRLLVGPSADLSPFQFYAFLMPIVAVMALGLYISLKADYKLSPAEHSEQVRFTRSFCISVGLICIVWVGRNCPLETREGALSYCSCLAQLLVFIVYTVLHFKKEEPSTRSNLIQLGLITGAFMIGFSYCLQLKPQVAQAVYFLNLPAAFWVLYVAWLICIYKWIQHFKNIIQISVN